MFDPSVKSFNREEFNRKLELWVYEGTVIRQQLPQLILLLLLMAVSFTEVARLHLLKANSWASVYFKYIM